MALSRLLAFKPVPSTYRAHRNEADQWCPIASLSAGTHKKACVIISKLHKMQRAPELLAPEGQAP